MAGKGAAAGVTAFSVGHAQAGRRRSGCLLPVCRRRRLCTYRLGLKPRGQPQPHILLCVDAAMVPYLPESLLFIIHSCLICL